MQKVAKLFQNSTSSSSCRPACLEETLSTSVSSSPIPDSIWPSAILAWGISKDVKKADMTVVEIYYTTLTVHTTTIRPQGLTSLLSNIGGSLGLYLGGSLFSIIELILITLLFTISMINFTCKTILSILQ